MILNVQFNEATGPGGEKIPAIDALQQMGPVVPVVLLPFDSKDGGQPKSVTGVALIDTGASTTCVDRKAAEDAGMTIVDTGRMSSATHHATEVPIFAGRMDIQGLGVGNTPRAFGAHLAPMGIVALIGRDFLKSAIMTYNGATGQFSIAR